jgi:glycosyltransferase involved in cell wall biosynthesis
MNRVLMVAFQFPPFAGSSGVQRTLRFARHLPQFGWEPLILTAHPRAYDQVSDDQLQDVPAQCVVERAFALDAARHLSILGRYPSFIARPDRWSSWWWGAVPKGLEMIRKYRPKAIWSTFPIATAHRIGRALHRFTGVPWIADFRDPMAQDGYPKDPRAWRSFKAIEQRALAEARYSVFVTPGAARSYAERYPEAKERVAVIENGYDEESFAALDAARADHLALVPGRITLLHSGVVYTVERNTMELFRALRRMLERGSVKPGQLCVRFRASANEATLAKQIAGAGLGQVAELAPLVSYRDALEEMGRADGLLILQAANCNNQIPAKAYEYVRCRKPIIALTDPAGDTAAFMRRVGMRYIARLDSADEIETVLKRFLGDVSNGRVPVPDDATVAGLSRLHRTRELAQLLDSVRA